MGTRNDAVARVVTGTDRPPGKGEFELTLLGPGYGESIALHVGDGAWVLVDSCIDAAGTPRALQYLESIDVDPSRAVILVVATHWHDDHIRGMAQLVETCDEAVFCCAGALCREEFLAAADALERRHLSVAGSGVREIHGVFSRLVQAVRKPTLAVADRRVLVQGGCEVWSLSPDDALFLDFLRSLERLFPGEGQGKTRIPALSPNEVAVALWIGVADVAVLLGSDLEKRGWTGVLQSRSRPAGRASVFKVPHHGSENAHEKGVWERILIPDPHAVLTPWHRGRGSLPSQSDVQRILSYTTNAYATARIDRSGSARTGRDRTVERTIRESGVKLRPVGASSGALRLRRPLGSGKPWAVEKFGSACRLEDFIGQ